MQRGDILDGFAFAKQDAVSDAFFRADGGGTHSARLVAFGQDDALAGSAGLLDQLIAEGGRRQLGVFRDVEGGRNGFGIEMFGDGFEHHVHAFDIVFGNRLGDFDDAPCRAEGIGAGTQDRYPPIKDRADQLHQFRVDFRVMGQQDAGDGHAPADGECGAENDVMTVAGSDDQRTGLQMRDEIGA